MPRIVPGYGPLDAKIVIVGEAPGREEEAQGIPFVGSSGRLLNDMLVRCGIDRKRCWLTNVMKTRPNNNDFGLFYVDKGRREQSYDLKESIGILTEVEIASIKPNLIIALGAEPLRALANKFGISKWRGSIIETPLGKVLPTYHPAYILRFYEWRAIAELDLKKAQRHSHFPELRTLKRVLEIQPSLEQTMDYLGSIKDRVAFDIETGAGFIRCLGLATSPLKSHSIPFTVSTGGSRAIGPLAPKGRLLALNGPENEYKLGSYWTLDEEAIILARLDKIFRDPKIELIAQNFPFDASKLAREFGFEFNNLWMDTMVAQHCLRKGTMVDTLKGQVQIENLVGQTPWVWSWKNNKPFPVKAKQVRLTRRSARLVRITYWSRGAPGKSLVFRTLDLTPDHRILVKGNWIEAQRLKIGDSLTRVKVLKGERPLLKLKGKFLPVSRYVWESLFSPILRGEIIHHKDENPRNNCPENLELISDRKHKSLHAKENPGWTDYIKENGSWNKGMIAYNSIDPFEVEILYNSGMSQKIIAERFGTDQGTISRLMKNHKIMPRSLKKAQEIRRENESNAKIISVEDIKERDDVYCMEVPDTHCFSANGIMVHNCCYSELPKSLDFLCSMYTDEPRYSDYNPESDLSTWRYNNMDCVITFEVALALEKEMKELNVWDFYRNLAQPAMVALARAGNRGVLIDLEAREKLRIETEAKLEVTKTGLSRGLGKDFNPNSHKQVKELFYDDYKIPPIRHPKTQQVTANEEALEKIAEKYPRHKELIDLILSYRGDTKLLGTFINSELNEEGRFPTSYNATGTKTGRISSSKTIDGLGGNHQQSPRGPFRRIFIAPPGKVLIKADLSQAEARVVAWVAGIESLIEKFQDPSFDVHTYNASLIFGISLDKVTKDQRTSGKSSLHSANYMGSPATAVKHAKVSYQVAKHALDRYKASIPELERWWSRVEDEIGATRMLRTPLGRLRIFMGRLNRETIRSAVAFVPQSTVGDIINRAFFILSNKLPPKCFPILQVHDEIVVEALEEDVSWCVALIRDCLQIPILIEGIKQPLKIPCEIKIGPNWFDMKEI